MTGPALTASYKIAGFAPDPMVTSSFTPAVGEVLVAKVVSSFGDPGDVTGGGLEWTKRCTVGNSNAPSQGTAIWTAITASATSMTVSCDISALYNAAVMVVERWSGASLGGAPPTVAIAAGSLSAPNGTIITTSSNSIVSFQIMDGAESPLAGRTYRTTSATPTEEYTAGDDGYGYTYFAAYQTASSPASQTFGMTVPSAQNYAMTAIEILDVSGPILLPNLAAAAAARDYG